MGTYVIRMPDIGEGIAEVELVAWHVKPGDIVADEQILADVMTDKASVEIPSHVAGKVVSIAGKPGDTLAVGSEIIRLEVEGKGNVADDAPAPDSPREHATKAAAITQAPAPRAVPPRPAKEGHPPAKEERPPARKEPAPAGFSPKPDRPLAARDPSRPCAPRRRAC